MIPDIAATAAGTACLLAAMDDPAIDAFTAAHADRRIRGAFRLAGTMLTIVLAFTLSLAALQAYHEGIVIVIPFPLAVCWLAGELVVSTRRTLRSRRQIPMARIVVR